mgnify:CR=1 FL=1
MNFLWLKQLMPRGLYGRAALILVLPVVTIQLVVSVVFIQRHFERVTRQMTQSMVHEIDLLDRAARTAPDLAAARARLADLDSVLGFTVSYPALPALANARGEPTYASVRL